MWYTPLLVLLGLEAARKALALRKVVFATLILAPDAII